MVQVFGVAGVPPASVVPQPPATRENGDGTMTLILVSAVLSVFDNVTVWTALATPGASNPKSSELGVKVAPVPVPLNVTGEPTTVALEVMVRYANVLPTPVGENATLIVHVWPAGTGVAELQVPPGATANIEPVENVALMFVTGFAVELVTVTVIAALVAPTLALGKLTVVG